MPTMSRDANRVRLGQRDWRPEGGNCRKVWRVCRTCRLPFVMPERAGKKRCRTCEANTPDQTRP